MKNIFCFLSILLMVSCSDSKLTDNFIGTYVDSENPSNTIEILNNKGEFKEKEANGCEVTGKFNFVDQSDANAPRFHITGFKFYESNNSCEDGIHNIGVTDYNDGVTSLLEDQWEKAGPNIVQAIRFGNGVYGGIGRIYFKK